MTSSRVAPRDEDMRPMGDSLLSYLWDRVIGLEEEVGRLEERLLEVGGETLGEEEGGRSWAFAALDDFEEGQDYLSLRLSGAAARMMFNSLKLHLQKEDVGVCIITIAAEPL